MPLHRPRLIATMCTGAVQFPDSPLPLCSSHAPQCLRPAELGSWLFEAAFAPSQHSPADKGGSACWKACFLLTFCLHIHSICNSPAAFEQQVTYGMLSQDSAPSCHNSWGSQTTPKEMQESLHWCVRAFWRSCNTNLPKVSQLLLTIE